jgi:hypothetical protein
MMRVGLRLTGTPLRRWHIELLEQLSKLSGVDAFVDSLSGERTSATNRRVERVFSLERTLHNRRDGPASLIETSALARYVDNGDQSADVLIDLTPEPLADQRVWRLLFDHQAGEGAGLAALRSGRVPTVTLVDADNTVLAAARPGSESPGVLVAAFDDLLVGCLSTIVRGVRAAPPITPSPGDPTEDLPVPSLLRHCVRQIVGASARRAYRSLYRAPHWKVGWRFIDGPGLIDGLAAPRLGWRRLPDDGHHFYADPFPIEHKGELFIFLEDYDHRVGRGVISVVKFNDSGPEHTPQPVLRHDVHLSYPMVFEDAGEIWMIPETSAARTVELYRAPRFPDRWELVGTLLEGLEVSDATVFQHRDRWWMTATVREGGSWSDALHVWHAECLTGPWRPHVHNPVLIDIASARPAGRVVVRGGRLLRPVQDGRFGYGAALAVAEITRLDEENFEQEVIGRLQPGQWWPGRRLHTLNRAGRLECIDGSAMSPRFWRPRQESNVQ